MSSRFVKVPDPVEISVAQDGDGNTVRVTYSLAEMVQWAIDNSAEYAKPVSAVRLGVETLTQFEAMKCPGEHVELSEQAWRKLNDVIEKLEFPLPPWAAEGKDGRAVVVSVPARRYTPLFLAVMNGTTEKPKKPEPQPEPQPEPTEQAR